MSLPNHSSQNLDADSAEGLLSVEPKKRQVEVQFLLRILQTTKLRSAQALGLVARATPDERFSQAYSRMQHPVFRELSRVLEQSVPQKTGFGKFRARD